MAVLLTFDIHCTEAQRASFRTEYLGAKFVECWHPTDPPSQVPHRLPFSTLVFPDEIGSHDAVRRLDACAGAVRPPIVLKRIAALNARGSWYFRSDEVC
jgi:hypothetical protein